MSTINNRELINKIIANNGYYETDPRVYCIVEYINAWGNVAYGVTWINESPVPRDRYRYHNPPYVNNPKVIWSVDENSNNVAL